MEACEQTKGMSVLDHGVMVNEYFMDLYAHIFTGSDIVYEWKIPEWLIENKDIIVTNLLDIEVINDYLVFHDCGKPYCLQVDEDGRRHFPNHAQASKDAWVGIGGRESVGELIGMDMDIHLLKDVGMSEFAQRPQAVTLLLAGLSEIHANASMFGGIDSTSFKMKWKQINKRGKKIVSLLSA